MRDGWPIKSLTDWEHRAGPKRATQWQGGRSAKEVARAWLAACPGLPSEVTEVLATQPSAFGSVEEWLAEPELALELDGFRGESRNTDLLVKTRDSYGDYLMAVEAKADEPFSETVADALAEAVERGLGPKKSNGVARIERLAAALFRPRQKETEPGVHDPRLGELRYQLLTAAGAVLHEADKSGHTRAVLLVHEFHTFATAPAKYAANASDLNTFVTRISRGAFTVVEPGGLYGPISVPGAPGWRAVPSLYIGKAVRDVPDPWPELRVLAQQGPDRFLLGDSPTSTAGFLVQAGTVAATSPTSHLARGYWDTPILPDARQAELVRRAKATL
ncbi:MAG: DUF6946 family protein [Gemmatimonadaceae bacterium]